MGHIYDLSPELAIQSAVIDWVNGSEPTSTHPTYLEAYALGEAGHIPQSLIDSIRGETKGLVAA